MKNLLPRTISGSVYIGLIILGTSGKPWLFAGLMAIFLIFCLFEFVKITALKDKLYLLLSFAASAGIFYYFSKSFFENQNMILTDSLSYAGPVLFLLAAFTIMFSTDEMKLDFGKATIGVIYIAVPFSLALTIPQSKLEFGETIISNEILFIFILIWISDVMAYVIGNLWGKHKLAPKISGGKTWEGAIGGVVFTIIAGYIFQQYIFQDSRFNWAIIGLIVAVTAPLGDLIESKLKRFFDVKDSSNLIPGHGGFLDRLDSFIFVIPMVYLYLLINQL